MLEKYINYLEKLTKKLAEYFENQKEYIVCKAGCGYCCSESYYPVSELEYEYLRIGLNTLSPEEREIINQKCFQIIRDRKIFLKTNPDIMQFNYICPLLTDNSCRLYEYRPMLCRSHGLVYIDVENPKKYNCPYCVYYGLNYANVWDKETKIVSLEKFKQQNFKNYPAAYDTSYSSLMKYAEGIKFGDVRMLVEWIIMDIPNYEELIKD